MHRAMGIPDGDHFQVISRHDPDEIIYDPSYLGIDRTDAIIFIQITLATGRTTEMKRALYARMLETPRRTSRWARGKRSSPTGFRPIWRTSARRVTGCGVCGNFSVMLRYLRVETWCREGAVMLAEALVALASAGGTAVVSAMATDAWAAVRTRTARVFGRGDEKKEAAAGERLDRARAELAKLSGAELARARARQKAAWTTRLADLLEEHPETESELRGLVEYVQSQVTQTRSSGEVHQQATAYDQAQQAVLGHGVMNVNFGDQRAPDDDG